MRALILMLTVLFLAGCQNQEASGNGSSNDTSPENGRIGYVVQQKDNYALVSADGDGGTWVRTADGTLPSIGTKVEVFFEGEIESSNPGRGLARRIDILTITGDGARITGEDALREALANVESWSVPVIKEIRYVPEQQQGSIVLYDDKNKEAGEKTFLIPDS